MKRAPENPFATGFTLIELLVVVAVVAILAAIAIPAYNEQVRKSRRAEAVQALSEMQLRQEQFRADNPTYGTLDQLTGSAAASTTYNNSLKNYNVGISGTGATGYTLTATPKGSWEDTSKCGNLLLTFAAGTVSKTVSAGDAAYCWRE